MAILYRDEGGPSIANRRRRGWASRVKRLALHPLSLIGLDDQHVNRPADRLGAGVKTHRVERDADRIDRIIHRVLQGEDPHWIGW